MIPLCINPEPSEVAAHPLFPVPTMKQQFPQGPICIRVQQWVFPAILLGTDFVLCIKARIQLKLRIREQSRELTTLHYCEEDAIAQSGFCRSLFLLLPQMQKNSSWCLCRPSEAAPPQQAGTGLIPKRGGSAHKVCLLSGLAWCLPVFPLVLT